MHVQSPPPPPPPPVYTTLPSYACAFPHVVHHPLCMLHPYACAVPLCTLPPMYIAPVCMCSSPLYTAWIHVIHTNTHVSVYYPWCTAPHVVCMCSSPVYTAPHVYCCPSCTLPPYACAVPHVCCTHMHVQSPQVHRPLCMLPHFSSILQDYALSWDASSSPPPLGSHGGSLYLQAPLCAVLTWDSATRQRLLFEAFVLTGQAEGSA